MSHTIRFDSKDVAMAAAREMRAYGLGPEIYRHAVNLARMRHRAALGRPGMIVKEHVTLRERCDFLAEWMLAGEGEV